MANDNYRKIFTAANLVSFLRIILLPFIIYNLAAGVRLWAIILIIISYLTDLVDGWLARILKQESYFGRIIDPLSDKISLAAVVIALYFTDNFPLWCVLIIVIRDLSILIGSFIMMKKKELVLPSNIFGKITGFVFGSLVFIYLLRLDILKVPALCLTVFLIMISFLSYLRIYLTGIKK